VQRRTTVLSIVLLLAFFAIGIGVVSRILFGGGLPLVSGDRVGIVSVQGIIESDAAFRRHLSAFAEDPTVRAFVVEIRSPGGVAGTAQSMYAELARLRAMDDRPVVAWIGEVGASGGYYVALGADSILALPGAITGSIGVIMELPNAEELMRKVGIGLEVVQSGEHKDLGPPVRELSEDERRILQELVDDVHEQFVSAVRENRRMEREAVLAVTDGRVVSGARAVDLGLVDRTGTLRDAVSVAGRMAGLGDDPQTVRPPERRIGWWDLLRGIEESRLRALATGLLERSLTIPKLRYQWP
jgi:protease-4